MTLFLSRGTRTGAGAGARSFCGSGGNVLEAVGSARGAFAMETGFTANVLFGLHCLALTVDFTLDTKHRLVHFILVKIFFTNRFFVIQILRRAFYRVPCGAR